MFLPAMAFSASLSYFLFFAITGFVALRRVLRPWISRPQGGKYAPGPKPKPLIGNLLDLPLKDASNVYTEWGKRYQSDILFASALGNHILVLNKVPEADELFEKRSRIYSDRPQLRISKIIEWDRMTGSMVYGDLWRLHRRIFHQELNQISIKRYYPVQQSKVHKFLRLMAETPEDFIAHSRMFSISVLMAMMYDYDVQSLDDPYVAVIERSVHLGTELITPGATLVDVFPFLQYLPSFFPGAGFQSAAEEVRQATLESVRLPMEFVKKKMDEGIVRPSFVSRFLEKKLSVGASPEEEKAVQDIACTSYTAASESVTAATLAFIHLMVTNPQSQAKAQAELDRVVGKQRLPTFEDRPQLPYVDAVYREVLRLKPSLQTGLGHSSTQDDYYQGYFIPKGTIVIPNIAAMSRDPDHYPEPNRFNPDRYLDSNGNLDNSRRVLAYGFGRRICVGKHSASATLFMAMASLLASFNFSKAMDEDGREIEVNDEYLDFGLSNLKAPFKCLIKPRSEQVKRLIEETAIQNY